MRHDSVRCRDEWEEWIELGTDLALNADAHADAGAEKVTDDFPSSFI